MTPEGYSRIVAVLDRAEVPALVSPEPSEGQDLPYVDIRTNQDYTLGDLLNLLSYNGLMAARSEGYGSPQLAMKNSELRTVAGAQTTNGIRINRNLSAAARVVTFRDLACGTAAESASPSSGCTI